MIRSTIGIVILAALLLWSMTGCASSRGFERPELSELSDTTDMCLYMDKVCSQAEDFQREYRSLSEGEKKDHLRPVLDTYIEHCQKASKRCLKSID
ncbi:MAG: hypothetical protein ACQEQV_09430 [Fibrobacterota bacterium]